jgi:hypothetical protein
MPVRKIPKNYLFVTGGYSSLKNEQMDAFESLLEKDYLLLLDFDDTVEKFETQPVRVPVPGVPNGYVPDVLIFYLPDADTGIVRRPSLVDVKHSDEVKRNEKKYAPKFTAATRFAESNGWEFVVVDQTQIRTSRLAFLKFLREYRNINPSEDDIQRVLECVGAGEISSQALLEALAPGADDHLYWLPIIWSMLLTRHLTTDLDRPLTNDVPLRRMEVGV